MHLCKYIRREVEEEELAAHSLTLSYKRRISPVGFSKWIPGFSVFPQAHGG
jgi:hypothetical protein